MGSASTTDAAAEYARQTRERDELIQRATARSNVAIHNAAALNSTGSYLPAMSTASKTNGMTNTAASTPGSPARTPQGRFSARMNPLGGIMASSMMPRHSVSSQLPYRPAAMEPGPPKPETKPGPSPSSSPSPDTDGAL
ncbi:uncharacterized protein B0I36DRAFT_333153, partial [Microdochium trichocladiopsis]